MLEKDPRTASGQSTEKLQADDFAKEAARLAADLRCENVRLLDVTGVSQICDRILLASGTSDRQMRTVATELEQLGKSHGLGQFRSTSDALDTWIVVDFIDLVIHLFEPGRREFYDLETLWSDGIEIDFDRPPG